METAMAEGENIRILIVDDVAETRRRSAARSNSKATWKWLGSPDWTRGDRPGEGNQAGCNLDGHQYAGYGRHYCQRTSGEMYLAQIIILSIQSDPNYMRRAMLAGARDFLTKPPMVSEMTAAIRRAGSWRRKNARSPAKP
jgi:pilus assembly protein CpaE